MGLPRSKYVNDGEVGVYHCFSRCVRRAYLYGYDPVTNRDYSHRKQWIVDRLRYLAALFAIQVCAYSVMENHDHTILRTRPDIADTWSDLEVATRWVTLCPKHRKVKGVAIPVEDQIHDLVDCPERIALLRKRLSSISWFMAQLNEFIARTANKEDQVKGRFWESRFKCQKLLDDIAIIACMVYADLNSIRAGLSTTPEDSDFTSIQERIRAWQRENMPDSIAAPAEQDIQPDLPATNGSIPESASDNYASIQNKPSSSWLCPISSDPRQSPILQMTPAEYFDLVDRSGRLIRADKRGAIDANLIPILLRIGANPDAWADTVSHFRRKFRLAAGRPSSLRKFASQIGRRWLTGVAAAQTAFA